MKQTNIIEELNFHIEAEKAINRCMRAIAGHDNLDDGAVAALEIVGEYLNADHCFAFTYGEDYSRAWCTQEWVRDEFPLQKEIWQNVDMLKLQQITDELKNHKVIVFDDIDEILQPISSIREQLQLPDMKTIVIAGVYISEKLIGFVAACYFSSHHQITDINRNVMENVGVIFTLAKQRRRRMDVIEESAKIQNLILDVLPIPLILINSDFTIVHANSAFCDFVKKPLYKMLHDNCFQHVCPQSLPDNSCVAQKALRTGEIQSGERHFKDRDIIIKVVPIYKRGQVVQLLESYIDITELNKNRELLRKAAETAEKNARAKSIFLATMSHELRTPLSAIIGAAELLQLDFNDAKMVEDEVKTIGFAADTLLSLINDILDLSKLEAGKMEFVMEKIDLNLLFQEMNSIFQPKIKKQNITLSFSKKGTIPLVYADSLRMRQILLNLIGNAVKFTSQGGIDVSVEFIPENSKTGILIINVQDSGVGISAENIGKIFDPFSQDNNARKVYGTGLGLPICKRLVEHMNGVLSVRSQQDKGSCFTVTLNNVSCEFINKGETISQKILKMPQTKHQIMVVDDLAINVKILSAMLAKLGQEVIATSSGIEALELMTKFQPDIVLSDMWMPDMRGDVLAVKLRALSNGGPLKIYATSGDSDLKNIVKTGIFDGFLQKPISMNHLIKILDL